jgi:hypothetical protein
VFYGVEVVWGFQGVVCFGVVVMGVPVIEAWQGTERQGVAFFGGRA